MPRQNIFKKSVKPRESGHYWVRWAGLTAHSTSPAIWRMGAYHKGTGWRLPGEERLYHDGDFLEINENRIPFTKGRMYTEKWYWVAVAANLIAGAFYIYYLLTHR